MKSITLTEAKRAVAKMVRMTDAELTFTMRDLSEAMCAAMDMGRCGEDEDPKMRQYAIEMVVGQAIQAKRARQQPARPALPVDVSVEDGIRYALTVRVF